MATDLDDQLTTYFAWVEQQVGLPMRRPLHDLNADAHPASTSSIELRPFHRPNRAGRRRPWAYAGAGSLVAGLIIAITIVAQGRPDPVTPAEVEAQPSVSSRATVPAQPTTTTTTIPAPEIIDSIDELNERISANAIVDMRIGEWALGRFEAMDLRVESRTDEVCIAANHMDGSGSSACTPRSGAPGLLTMGYTPPGPDEGFDLMILASSRLDVSLLVDGSRCESAAKFELSGEGASLTACSVPLSAKELTLIVGERGSSLRVDLPIPSDDGVTIEVVPQNTSLTPPAVRPSEP